MAWLINQLDLRIEIANGSDLVEGGMKLGIPFSCVSGSCGTCKTKILKGMQNLSELSEEEEDYGLAEGYRLICQCKIIGDEVVLEI